MWGRQIIEWSRKLYCGALNVPVAVPVSFFDTQRERERKRERERDGDEGRIKLGREKECSLK